MTGFVALHREAFSHPVLKDPARFRAWFWIVAHAAWKPTKHDARGHTITVDRGQLCAGREYLAKEWGWSPSAVERFLTRLETEQMIERKTGQMKTVITICNYDKYQDVPDETEHMSGQQFGQKPDRNRTTKEEGKQGNKVKEEPSGSPFTERARKGTRLSPSWEPEPFVEDLADAVAAWPAGAIERELARFRDWAASAPGQKGVKTDWQATWRNWCRRRDDEGTYRNGSNVRTSGHQGPDRRNGLAKAIDRELAGTSSPAFPEMPPALECHATEKGW